MNDWLHSSLGSLIIDWWRSSDPDPWETVEGFLLSDYIEADHILCFNCLCPIHHLSNFCPECAAPIGPYCWYHPWWRVFANGHVARRLVSQPVQRWVYTTVVTTCCCNIITNLFLSYGFWAMSIQDVSKYFSAVTLITVIILFNILFVYRVTRNYFSQQKSE